MFKRLRHSRQAYTANWRRMSHRLRLRTCAVGNGVMVLAMAAMTGLKYPTVGSSALPMAVAFVLGQVSLYAGYRWWLRRENQQSSQTGHA